MKITQGKEAQIMADEKQGKFSALGNKIKEHAAAQAAENTADGGKRGLFGFGNKPANNATTSAAKPTVAAASAKPTAKPAAATSVKPAAKVSTPFKDVPSNAYYAQAVAWAVQKKITSGVSDTEFAPQNPCHRGHAATFLWRAKGSPAPRAKLNPYSDVSEDSPFYKAILWAAENKIIEPKSSNAFEPTAPCTRGDVLTYLYRAEVKSKATQADAVKWAGTKNLLSGFSGGVDTPCTRADIVTLLYRVKTN